MECPSSPSGSISSVTSPLTVAAKSKSKPRSSSGRSRSRNPPSEDKRHTCPICNEKFCTKSAFRWHKKLHHNRLKRPSSMQPVQAASRYASPTPNINCFAQPQLNPLVSFAGLATNPVASRASPQLLGGSTPHVGEFSGLMEANLLECMNSTMEAAGAEDGGAVVEIKQEELDLSLHL